MTSENKNNTIWCVTVTTKHGTDVILLRQEKEPTIEELEKIEEKFKYDYDLSSAYASAECGFRLYDSLPTSVEEYLKYE